MTRVEFEQWLELHYEELVKVARKRVNDEDEARDAVQTAAMQMLAVGGPRAAKAWAWAVLYVRGACRDDREKSGNLSGFRRALKKDPASTPSLGWKRPGVSRACSDPTKSWEDAR